MAGGLGIKISAEHVERLQDKLKPEAMMKAPLRDIWSRAGLLAQRKLMENSPVDTGRLKSSWGFELDRSDTPMFVKVGTSVDYAAALEFGGGKPRGVGIIPFFRPTIKNLKGKMDSLIQDALKVIDDQWGRQ